ncbi:hypothetical protein [Ideonella sp.]|uniref:hypothetical protein n=1 Tax=Ideonella sp. TaxID=1929293 RepID=UPI002B459FD3|nr:hypothetical protein [Ideonella sp.]HJV68445.1 hypothetical protein [Ideonella sp.]
MKTIRSLPLAMALSASAVLLSAGGCATSPPTPPIAEKMTRMPMGSVVTYHRKSSGSLGDYDGQVVWTLSTRTWQGREVVASTAPGVGATLSDPASLALLAFLDAKGSTVTSYDPPMAYQWPLQVGKAWSSQYMMTVPASGRAIPLKIDWKVEAWEDVTVPAGTFKAYRLSWINSLGEAETRWVSPATGIDPIKRHVERSAMHPQGPGVLDAELLSSVVPAK